VTIIGDAFVQLRPEGSTFGNETQSVLSKVFKGLGPLAPIAGVAATIVTTLGAIGEEFDKQFKQIQIDTGATGTQLQGLEGVFKQVFSTSASSAADVEKALATVSIRTGLTGQALEGLTKQEVDLARITKTDVGGTVDSTTQLFNKFGIAAKDQGAALDTLFKATQASGKGIDTLSGDLKRTEPVLSSFGLTFGQQTAIVAELENSGARVTSVVTGLGKVFSIAAKQGEDPVVLFNKMLAQLKAFPSAADATTFAVQNFGIRAGPELARAVRAGNFDATKLFAQITSGKGGIEATATATETLGTKFKILKNGVETALQPAGQAVLNFADTILSKLAPVLLKDIPFDIAVAKNAFEQGFNKGLTDKANGITTAISRVGQVVRGLGDGWKNLQAPKNASDFERLANVVGQGAHKLFDGFKLAASAVGDVFGGKLKGFHEGATIIVDGLAKDGLSVQNFEAGLHTLSTNTGPYLARVVDGFKKLPGDFVKGLEVLPGVAAKEIGKLGSAVVKEFEKLGEELIKGLVSGIVHAGETELKDAFTKPAENLLKKAKSFFGVASPSTVFAEIGRSLIDGLAVGITTRAPVAQGAVNQLGLKVPALTGGLPTIPGSNVGPAAGSGTAVSMDQKLGLIVELLRQVLEEERVNVNVHPAHTQSSAQVGQSVAAHLAFKLAR